MKLLDEKGLSDVLVVLGGIVPDADLPGLKAIGVSAVFRPGTAMQDIIDFIEADRAHRLGADVKADVKM